MDPPSSSILSEKSEGKEDPREKVHSLLENWNITQADSNAEVLNLYFNYVKNKVKDSSKNDLADLAKELELAEKLSRKLAIEHRRQKMHVLLLQRERSRAIRGLLEIECFVLEITEQDAYVPKDVEDWVSGIRTKEISKYSRQSLANYFSSKEADADRMLAENGVTTPKLKKRKEKIPTTKTKASRNFDKYQAMDNNGKDNYIKEKRAKHGKLFEKLAEECELWEMAMLINRKYSGHSYTLMAKALVSLLRDTINGFGVKDVAEV